MKAATTEKQPPPLLAPLTPFKLEFNLQKKPPPENHSSGHLFVKREFLENLWRASKKISGDDEHYISHVTDLYMTLWISFPPNVSQFKSQKSLVGSRFPIRTIFLTNPNTFSNLFLINQRPLSVVWRKRGAIRETLSHSLENDGMIFSQGLMSGGDWWVYSMLVISVCFYVTGQGPMSGGAWWLYGMLLSL